MSTATARSREPRVETDLIAVPSSIPPLENGDRLSRPEFERRYDAMPGVKAELIEGIVYMASPVSYGQHGKPHFHAIGWLNLYRSSTPGVDGADNASIRLDLDNMPQPDAFLLILPERGGQVRISEDDYVEFAPELIVEVASSSVSYDLHAKLQAYRRNGVKEYVVWRTRDGAVDWFVAEDGQFVPLAPGADGLYRSRILPGLWLDPVALMADDRARMVHVNQEGTASPEHAAFVERLKLASAPKPAAGG
jgi:Uma2 family endonuclease